MLGDRQRLRHTLYGAAADQAGYFTAAQALSIGYSYQAQKFHVDHGNWIRVERGLFRLPEWPTDDNDTLVKWTVWSRGEAVVSHQSALAWHGLGDVNPSRLHLSVPSSFRRSTSVVVLHRAVLLNDDIEDHGNFRVTTPLRSVIDVAADGTDQAAVSSAIVDLVALGSMEPRVLLDRAAQSGAQAELGVVRGLAATGRQS